MATSSNTNGTKTRIILILVTTLWTLVIGIGTWEVRARLAADAKSEDFHRQAAADIARANAQFEAIQQDLDEIKIELREIRKSH